MSRSTRRVRLVASATVIGATFLALVPGSAGAEPVRAGDLPVVDERGHALAGGGSETKFTFRLPADDAFCPGDSANDNYRVNSFMVPVDVAAAAVTYDGLGPEPQHYESYDAFRMPLYDEFTADYTSSLTAEHERPGGPGRIVNVPNLWFGVYRKGELPIGRYRMGLVCTHVNEIEKYWDTEIVVRADSDDRAGIAWRLANATSSSDDDSGVGPAVLIGLVATAVGGFAYQRRARRAAGRRPAVTTSEERP